MIQFLGRLHELVHRELANGQESRTARMTFDGIPHDFLVGLTKDEAAYMAPALKKGARVRVTLEVVTP